ncbi:ATP-binding cassette sub-family G member 1 [Caerostris extrusa]|uniref:ATP-binding cassette sub-family G member 1 n=1 Tax=Caerostris extrusa TaxID=172846 RepID=A0AAV4QUV2_CAEEX|nr:ATP-binding cassette sub-family G member 1 [Caerostris extrusa]
MRPSIIWVVPRWDFDVNTTVNESHNNTNSENLGERQFSRVFEHYKASRKGTTCCPNYLETRLLQSKMAELVSIQKFDSPPGLNTPPQWAVRVLVPPAVAKGKEAATWVSTPTGTYEIHADSPPNSASCPPVNLEWRNIALNHKGKPILKGVSGNCGTGELTAIMGPSGAGKSTLLNVLSGFTRAKVSGRINMNGAPRDMRVFRKLSCYIMQDDYLLPHLTVRESIQLAAQLKIPSHVSRQERENAVDECLESLGLAERRDNKASQLSGGQRKRLCIAQELVSNPPLIFLDEPTSGLDSSSCLQCIQLLKSLAQEGRTVICTIHQPSARVFEIFDKLYMLAEGQCIYRGSTLNLIPFLKEQGLNCPQYHNPADFATEVAAGEHGEWIWKLKKATDDNEDTLSLTDFDGRSEPLLQASTLCLLEEGGSSLLQENALEDSFGGYATSSWNQFKVLTYRSLICTLREPVSMIKTFSFLKDHKFNPSRKFH